MEQKIIFATGNQGKMREIRAILSDLGLPVLSMKEAGVFSGYYRRWNDFCRKCPYQGQSCLGAYRRDRIGR